MTYRVVWEIDIEAETPEEAARKALEIQRDHSSGATVFDCINMAGNMHRVDLTAIEQDASQ